MADTEDKQAKKPDKQRPLDPDAAAKAEKKAARQDKAAAAAGKAEKADKAGKKPREAEPRVPARLKVQFEEAIRGNDLRALSAWITAQPPWSDFPFVLLTGHGGGPERNPAAAELMRLLGNVTFLERPFHPTTLISVVETGLRGRRRQYECQRLNEQLELRVEERTGELAAGIGRLEFLGRPDPDRGQLRRVEDFRLGPGLRIFEENILEAPLRGL